MGAENTDCNYRNRNAEDEKSQGGKKNHAFTRTKMYIHDKKKKKKKNAHRPASTFTPAGQTRTLRVSRWMRWLEIGFTLLHRPPVTLRST